MNHRRLLSTIIIGCLTLLGFGLRLRYMTTSHPFFDEYTTVLAARQILQHGWPVLPSGLFYEHGLLATYLITPFTALFITTPIDSWQPAHWGLMLSRWPSVLLGTATIPLIYAVAKRNLTIHNSKVTIHNYFPALLAAGLFALSPEGVVWGGRARMYALATLLVLATVVWAYRGAVHPAPAKYRWAAILALLAALLTQFGALMVVPPLVIAMLFAGWLTRPPDQWRLWFLRPPIVLEGLALGGVIGLAILVKRLGQPLGAASLTTTESDSVLTELINTVTYQTAFHFTWPDTLQFLARQFGVPHHLWLTALMLLGTLAGLFSWLKREKNIHNSQFRIHHSQLFLWLVFGLVIVEMVTLLEPFRRNPRYIVMVLPLFYLLAGQAIFTLWRLVERWIGPANNRDLRLAGLRPLAALTILTVLTLIGFGDLRIALLTPEPAYETAFATVRAEWQPGDTLLTMNTSAAGLYLGRQHVAGFTVQGRDDADQFLLNKETTPVDRWLGVPWVGQVTEFNAVLNRSARTWFVIDTIRQPVYFQGDWLAVVNHQMEPVWSGDNALVYRTRPDRTPLPSQPTVTTEAVLSDTIQLTGYTLPDSTDHQLPITNLHLTLFWQALAALPTDYTVFLHLRNAEGVTVAQSDAMPVDSTYPTSRWRPGETVIDPITLALPQDLPQGTYRLLVGMYRLDTLERLPLAGDTSGENAILLGEVDLP